MFVISDSNYKKTNVGCVKIALIFIRYDKHPLFGPALDKNKPSTTRRKHWFFIWTHFNYFVSWPFFLASYEDKSKVGGAQKLDEALFWGLLDTAKNIIGKNHLGIVWGHPTRRLKAENPYFSMQKFSMSKELIPENCMPFKIRKFSIFHQFCDVIYKRTTIQDQSWWYYVIQRRKVWSLSFSKSGFDSRMIVNESAWESSHTMKSFKLEKIFFVKNIFCFVFYSFLSFFNEKYRYFATFDHQICF